MSETVGSGVQHTHKPERTNEVLACRTCMVYKELQDSKIINKL